MKLVFGKWSCGCIGFRAEDSEETFLITPCDEPDGKDYAMHRSTDRRSNSLKDKEFTPITGGDFFNTMYAIDSLIDDGYKYRQVKDLLS